MRIAWIGPTPSEHGGVPFVGTLLLEELARQGIETDCFVAALPEEIPPRLRRQAALRFFLRDSGWRWDRWYSRQPMLAFFSGNLTRVYSHVRLAASIAAEHRRRPYDLVYQFSQLELSSLRGRRDELPPIVVHPETHAAGELSWHRREAHLSRRCEPLPKRVVVRTMLMSRAWVQKRDVPLASRVLAVSTVFGEHLAHDYRIPGSRLGVVPNPIDIDRFRPPDRPIARAGPIELLFVSRMSARKGVEMVIDLSHRLSDLAGRVRIRVIGGPTTWSDYRPLLESLNTGVARYDGGLSPHDLSRLYQTAGAILQPSRYEPFALTVGEALASGCPAVASDEVGATEGVDPRVCQVFRAGDLDGFEREVRRLVTRLESGDDPSELHALARAEAVRLYSPEVIVRTLIVELRRALESPRGTGAA